jgi:hypothetical protein
MQYIDDNAGGIGLVAQSNAILDDKRTQIGAIAQKKRLVFDVSYNQYQMRNVARQLIEKAIAYFVPNPYFMGKRSNLRPLFELPVPYTEG